ncbi:hypothetical protein E2C01_082836 [Portunus trituberculatus]|uniref:Uncharacterized protein n=1 Tax=Portunus trituberculatus TaxID=210409 RepID=A0A5B7IVL3_PORTR|nr:hypothetical protein [Portunus trituberculatus]
MNTRNLGISRHHRLTELERLMVFSPEITLTGEKAFHRFMWIPNERRVAFTLAGGRREVHPNR